MEMIKSDYLDEKLTRVRAMDFLKYRSSDLPTWCPGCGYFGIMDAFYKSLGKVIVNVVPTFTLLVKFISPP